MKFSTLPFLLSAVLIFIPIITQRAVRLRHLQSNDAKYIYWLIDILALWTVASSVMSREGFYASSRFWALLPGLWFPLVPVSLCLISKVRSQTNN